MLLDSVSLTPAARTLSQERAGSVYWDYFPLTPASRTLSQERAGGVCWDSFSLTPAARNQPAAKLRLFQERAMKGRGGEA